MTFPCYSYLMIRTLLTLSVALLLAACSGLSDQAEWNPTAAAPAVTAPQTVSAPAQTFAATPPANSQESRVTKVALLVPLTGPHADIGEAMQHAAQLALFDLGGPQIQLLPRDTGDSPAGAERAADEAVHDGADIILGPLFASHVRSAASVAARAGIPLVAFSTDWTLAGGNTYVLGFVPFGQVQRVVRYAASQGIHRVAVVTPDGEYGDAVQAAYEKEARRDGITTTAEARLTNHGADAAAATIAGGGMPDAVLIAIGGPDAKAVSDALATRGLAAVSVRRLGTGLWDDPALSEDPSLQGAWFAAPSPDLRRDFFRRYGDTFGNRPPRLATLAYDATALAAVLAKKGDGGRAAFTRAALINPNGFAGVDGVFRFLPGGVAERGLAILTFRDNAIGVQDAAPRTFQQWQGQ